MSKFREFLTSLYVRGVIIEGVTVGMFLFLAARMVLHIDDPGLENTTKQYAQDLAKAWEDEQDGDGPGIGLTKGRFWRRMIRGIGRMGTFVRTRLGTAAPATRAHLNAVLRDPSLSPGEKGAMCLMWLCGLRPGEPARLSSLQLAVDNLRVHLYRTKSDPFGVGQTAVASDPLLMPWALRAEPISYSKVLQISKSVGLMGASWRRGRAQRADEIGGLEVAAATLRHKSTKSTQPYLDWQPRKLLEMRAMGSR